MFFDPATTISPLIRFDHLARVEAFVSAPDSPKGSTPLD